MSDFAIFKNNNFENFYILQNHNDITVLFVMCCISTNRTSMYLPHMYRNLIVLLIKEHLHLHLLLLKK